MLTVVMGLAAAPPSRADTPVDRFIADLDSSSSIPADVRDMIRSTWQRCEDCDGGEFLAQGLSVFSDRFREGLDNYDSEKYERAASVMGSLVEDANPFVATNAAVWEIKALIAMDRPTDAAGLIETLSGGEVDRAATYSYFAAEIDFLRGFCLLADLQYDEAAIALRAFLTRHSDASQRLVISAQQMLAELANRQPERIGEVTDLMDYSARRLRIGDSGGDVQGRQQRILELLDNLIEEAEQQEQNANNSNNSGGGQDRSPQSPMPQSQLPQGGDSRMKLRESRRASPADAWGAMPPAERERVLQALRDSFPARYRRLVEQYYEQLAKEP
ncbi:MAG: hypothetical protein IID36_11760 [Planctomycetes bacterium]|nr:hypothetical protein [Planctomycetota bacterium]